MSEPWRDAQGDILVVDDSRANLELLSDILRDLGHRVRPVSSGSMALEAAAHRPPDIILLDINMPGMTGYEVCEALKADTRLFDVPVLFITALSDIRDKVRAFEVGCVDFIVKPYRREEVSARVSAHLRVQHLKTSLEERNRELMEAHDDLLQLSKFRDNLLHMIVHDLRSPLTGIVSSLRLMEEDLFQSEGGVREEDVRQALSSSEVLLMMINDLLDISRLESAKLPLRLEEVAMSDVTASALALLGPARSPRVRVIGSGGDLRATCDRSLLERVVVNLLDNALKHSPPRRPVDLQFKADRDTLTVSVFDEGPGIPDAHKDAVFEKFGQLEARKWGGVPSTGLGLTFCKLVAESHHGVLTVHDREGEGSEFRMRLPLRMSTLRRSDVEFAK